MWRLPMKNILIWKMEDCISMYVNKYGSLFE